MKRRHSLGITATIAGVVLAGGLVAAGPTPGSTGLPGTGCTRTLGYWKTHPGAWPVPGLKLGTVTYTETQLLLILSQPVVGNGLVSLAQQLIAAKLNVAGGAAAPAEVTAAIAQSDALIGTRIVPPIGTGRLLPGVTSALDEVLDAYNNGLSGTEHCGTPVPTQPATWGVVKSLYR